MNALVDRLRCDLMVAGLDDENEALRPLVTAPRWDTRALERLLPRVERLRARLPRDPELRALRGRLLSLLGEESLAAAELRAVAARSPAAQAWLGELALRRGDPTTALPLLRAAAERNPSRPWTRLHLALAMALLGDEAGARAGLAGCLHLWNRAAWACGAAGLLEVRAGRTLKAMRLLARALRANPSPAWSEALIEVALERGHARRAAEFLKPGTGRLRRGDLSLLIGRLRLTAGDPAGAVSALSRPELSADPEALYHRGRAELSRARARSAARLFQRAAGSVGAERARLCSFLALLADVRARRAAPRRTDARVTICGLGLERPYDMTLETADALAQADVVFLHGDRRDLRETVEALGARVRGSMGLSGLSGRRLWDEVIAELALGRRVVYATYGHPLLYSDGFDIVKGCLAAKIAMRVLDAASTLDAVLSGSAAEARLLAPGFFVVSAIDVIKGIAVLDPGLPTLLFNARHVEEKDFARLCALLDKAYGPGHVLTGFVADDGLSGARRSRLRVERLKGAGPHMERMTTLIIPPRDAKGA